MSLKLPINLARDNKAEQGFSLLELLIAMIISLTVLAAATSLLTRSLGTRSRENLRSEALAATQRGLNIMSREIGNSGFGLEDNGIVTSDSSATSIRVRADLNNNWGLAERDEDVHYIYQSANQAIVRYDAAVGGTPVPLASGVTAMTVTYWDAANLIIANPANYTNAERLTIDISVNLPAGTNQPASVVRMVSDVALRNSPNTLDYY
jgi:prepilin-type N-terminal cleavage/methylation domain-containing protein